MRKAGSPLLIVEMYLLDFWIAVAGASVPAVRSLRLFDFFPGSLGSFLPDTFPIPRSIRSFWLHLGLDLREQLPQCLNSPVG